jgi:hypothetical protein
MTTVLDIVTDAMQESGVLTKSETPTNDEAQTGLRMLNRLVGSWSNSSVVQFERVTESFPLTDGVTSYTIGSGGDFDTVRPTNIVQAHVRQGNTDYNLQIVSDKIYQSVVYKSVGGLPEILNFTNEYPLATINIYTAPSGTYTLFLTSEKPLTSYASTAATVDLPSGWIDALIYALAVRLARVYGQPTDPALQALARESKAMISLNSLKNNPLQSQVPSRASFNNIYSGYYS